MNSVFAVYDRDKNVSGDVQPYSFVPEYKSSVSFKYKDPYVYAADNYFIKYSKNLNNTEISFDLKFTNKTEEEAKSFLYFLEGVEASESGVLDFNSLDQTGIEIAFPTGNVYKNMSGFLVDDYDFKYNKNLFDVNLKVKSNSFSYFFDWQGSSYLNTGNFNTGWVDGTSYEKFDVIYYPEYNTGDRTNIYPKVNRIEKFYYCSSDHTSNFENSPTGVSGNVWSRSFFYDIDDGINISTSKSSSIYDDKSSFMSFNKKNGNESLIKDLRVSLKNRSDKETRSIMHFIEKHEDARPFQLDIPQLYVKKKFFVAKQMKHTFVYKDCNNIEITLDEIVKFKEDQFLDAFYVN
jgi:phage-related protein